MRKPRPRSALAALALVAWAACAGLVPRQGWDPSYGPVVPHDSFPADCSLCHAGGDWHGIAADFSFDHAAETGMELVGAHRSVACLLCHNDRGPAGRYAARGCAGCHVDIHRGKVGAACTDCHDEISWVARGMIARHQRTRFPLLGPHAAAACWACHPGAQVGNFEGLNPDCETCHQSDLQRATSPDHIAQGLTADCQRCHVQITWSPARFAHPASFPLTGGHAGLDCSACHQGGVYTGLSTACVGCHLDDYQQTTNPNHMAAGFGTDCRLCHTTSMWQGAVFNHRFPISNGPHSVLSCADCHTNPGMQQQFSCTHCHAHRQSEANSEHQGVPGYIWSSPACLSCHPQGRS